MTLYVFGSTVLQSVRKSRIHRMNDAASIRRNVIENNDIFNCVKETSDHGPINSWGRGRFWPLDADDATKKSYAKLDAMETTVIRHNRIWHSSHWDIDLDDGSSNYLIENNLPLNGGVKLREGFHRTVLNNIFVNGGAHFHVWYADNGDVIENNVFATDNPYDLIGVDMAKSRPVIDKNVFWNNGKGVADINDAWRAQGLDVGSVIADPQFTGSNPFTDPKKLEYTVAAGSPALGLGFKNIAMDGFGKAGAPPAAAVAGRTGRSVQVPRRAAPRRNRDPDLLGRDQVVGGPHRLRRPRAQDRAGGFVRLPERSARQ